MIATEENVVSDDTLRQEVKRFRSFVGTQSEFAEAFAALTLCWFAWEVYLSERQAVEVLHFFGERSPEAIAAVKKTFIEWFEGLDK